MSNFHYIGSELELFATAQRWKSYYRSYLAPYLKGEVLEVGAGTGSTTAALSTTEFDRWVCLEPDPELAAAIPANASSARHETIVGRLRDLQPQRRFDAILYIDVLEHIEDAHGELALAATHLNKGGALLVLAPAHQCLYTAFDRAVGHFLRYTKESLRAIAPDGLAEREMLYLDSAGLLASLGNRLLLRKAMPTGQQIRFWDRTLVPISAQLDRILGHRVGKSVLGIWINE